MVEFKSFSNRNLYKLLISRPEKFGEYSSDLPGESKSYACSFEEREELSYEAIMLLARDSQFEIEVESSRFRRWKMLSWCMVSLWVFFSCSFWGVICFLRSLIFCWIFRKETARFALPNARVAQW